MNEIDLRQAILNRVQGNSVAQLTETIEASVDGDELTLPGLGVLFEIIWQQSTPNIQEQMVQSLHSHIHGHNTVPSY